MVSEVQRPGRFYRLISREPGGSPVSESGDCPLGPGLRSVEEAGGRRRGHSADLQRGLDRSLGSGTLETPVPDSKASTQCSEEPNGGEPSQAMAPPVGPFGARAEGSGFCSCPCSINPDPIQVARVFVGASRVDVPPLPNRNPRKYRGPDAAPAEGPAKRGVVSGFSQKSRRNLQRELATLSCSAEAFTMALTLPGDGDAVSQEEANDAFATLARRFASKKEFKRVAVMWKRELQKRGALHWHLLLYGLADDPELEWAVRFWLVTQWNALVCMDVSAGEREHHRWWHIANRWNGKKKRHEENWERVRDMAGYFSKYLGKDPETDQTSPVPGRWWGSWNKRSLPHVSPTELPIPPKVAADFHRVMRKKRQKNANEGKHRALVRLLDFKASPFQSGASRNGSEDREALSQWDLIRLKSGYVRDGRSRRIEGSGVSLLDGMKESDFHLRVIQTEAKARGLRFGKFAFRGMVPNTASLVVMGSGAPDMALSVLRWAFDRHGLEMPELLTRDEKVKEARKRRIRKGPLQQGLLGIHGQGVDGTIDSRSGSRADALRRGRLSPAYAGSAPD